MASTNAAEIKKAKRLLDTARSGDLRAFKRAANKLEKDKGLAGAIRSACDKFGNGPLHLAAAGGNTPVCRYLIDELNFDPNSSPHTGKTPIIHAASGGHVDTIEYLIDRGANLDARASDGFTAISTAILEGRRKALRVLASRGGPVEAEYLTGSPLLLAAYFDDAVCMRILLDHNADPNKVCEFISALVVSVTNDSINCVEVLRKAGADLNKIPLLERALDSEEMILYLLTNGASPNIPNESGRFPIEIAAAKRKKEIVNILFPLTSPIATVPEWSIKGLFSYVASDDIRKEEQSLSNQRLKSVKHEIKHAFNRKEYFGAAVLSDFAVKEDPSDNVAKAIRILCWKQLSSALIATGSRSFNLSTACSQDRLSSIADNQYEDIVFALIDGQIMGPTATEILQAL